MRIHRRFARLFGYDLLHIQRRHPSLEAHLAILFPHLGINLVLDVGANTGQYATLLRNNGYKGHIISFEPVAKNIEALQVKSKNDPKWTICPYGLGSTNETLDINVTHLSTFSSFLNPNKYAGKLFKKDTPIDAVVEVEVKCLDTVYGALCTQINQEPVIPYLKMDTQGYDLEVLKGAINTIKFIAAFQSEISLIPLYSGMPDYIESLNFFKTLGFSMTGMYTVTRDRSNQLLVETECVMRRLPDLT